MHAYNEEELIEMLASSIRNQSIIQRYLEHFEFLIVNNCSTDNTKELAIPFADKVLSYPRGKLSARNHGTSMSKCRHIQNLDALVNRKEVFPIRKDLMSFTKIKLQKERL